MTRHHIIALTALAVLAGLLTTIAPAAASNAIAERTDLACTVCHDKPGSKLMTDRGKYWEAVGSLEGFDQLQERFAQCTDCHVRKPGSAKLTRTGERYQWMLEDMEGLRTWLMERHPATLSPEEAADGGGDG